MGKKGDLSDFEHGMVVGARRAGLSISKTADLLGFLCTTISPHRVLLQSAKNRKRRLQFAQVHQNWTINDWKNVWSDESRFLLRHSDHRVRIWRKEHESMDASCLVSTVQAGGGGVMCRGYFLGTLWAP